MLTMTKPRPASRTIQSWAIALLLEEGAIKQCPEHGYMQCRGDPDARARAFAAAGTERPEGLSAAEAVAALHDVLGGVGDSCPDC